MIHASGSLGLVVSFFAFDLRLLPLEAPPSAEGLGQLRATEISCCTTDLTEDKMASMKAGDSVLSASALPALFVAGKRL